MTSINCQQDASICQAIVTIVIPILGTRVSIDMPGFQTKLLTITIVCGNDSGIFPCNFVACLAQVLSSIAVLA